MPGRGVYHTLSDDQGNRPTGDPVRYYTGRHRLRATERSTTATSSSSTSPNCSRRRRRRSPPVGSIPKASRSDARGSSSCRRRATLRRLRSSIRSSALQPQRASHRRPSDSRQVHPNGVDWGVRFNLSFESLNLTPNGRKLVTAGEGALFQDGPASTFTNGSLARILEYDLRKRTPDRRVRVRGGAVGGAVGDLRRERHRRGASDRQRRDHAGDGALVLGRWISAAAPATWSSSTRSRPRARPTCFGIDALYDGGSPIAFTPVSQRQVFAFDDLGIPIDNIEGMTFGPTLPDGRRTLGHRERQQLQRQGSSPSSSCWRWTSTA